MPLEHMEEFVKTFHIDWKLMIAQIINFGLVFLIFYFLTAKPLSKLVKERTEEINTGLVNAESNKKILENTKKEYDSMLAQAKNEAHTILQSSKKDAELKKTAMLEEAKKEVENMIINGRKTLEAEKTKMVGEAKKEIVSVVIQATEKVLGNSVDKTYQDRIVKDLSNL